MSKSETINRYLDVRETLDAALALNAGFGEICGRVPTPTRGAAVHWRQRAYTFMKIYREKHNANSQYDRLSFPMIPKEGSPEPEEGWGVTIKMAGRQFGFVASREAVPPSPIDDPLLGEALRLGKDSM